VGNFFRKFQADWHSYNKNIVVIIIIRWIYAEKDLISIQNNFLPIKILILFEYMRVNKNVVFAIFMIPGGPKKVLIFDPYSIVIRVKY
jgi:hypothetical protein